MSSAPAVRHTLLGDLTQQLVKYRATAPLTKSPLDSVFLADGLFTTGFPDLVPIEDDPVYHRGEKISDVGSLAPRE